MTDDLFANWHSEYTQADWDAMNQRLADMDVPDYTLQPSHHYRPRVSWFTLPTTKRPEKVEGPKRSYNVTSMYQREFDDGTGAHVQQLHATINGRNVIVSKYDNGDYIVKSGKHAYKATDDTLDDVIDGCVE